jgi:hypothetical protein
LLPDGEAAEFPSPTGIYDIPETQAGSDQTPRLRACSWRRRAGITAAEPDFREKRE